MTNEIKEIRKQLGWSQREMANYLGCGYHTVLRWERGLTRPSALSVKMLNQLRRDISAGRVLPDTPQNAHNQRQVGLRGKLVSFINWIRNRGRNET